MLWKFYDVMEPILCSAPDSGENKCWLRLEGDVWNKYGGAFFPFAVS